MYTYTCYNFIDILLKCCSCYKRDERCLFLYVRENGDDFQIFFPSALRRQQFLDLILVMTKDQEGMITDLDLDTSSDCPKVRRSSFISLCRYVRIKLMRR